MSARAVAIVAIVAIDPARARPTLAAGPAQRCGPRPGPRGVRRVAGPGSLGRVDVAGRPALLGRPRRALEDASAATATVEAAAASVPAPDDPVISVMFTLAVVALSVLTIGVAYLSISSFLDQRQEEEVRRRLPA